MYRKLLVLVDDREATQSAIRHGIAMARAHRADILFFHVLPRYVIATFDALPAVAVSPEEFQRQANDHAHTLLMAASALAEQAGVQSFRAMSSCTEDVQCICDMATHRHCDLIVVATDGDNAVMRILTGSVIPGLITASKVPVLVCQGHHTRTAAERRQWAALQARQKRELRTRRRRDEDND